MRSTRDTAVKFTAVSSSITNDIVGSTHLIDDDERNRSASLCIFAREHQLGHQRNTNSHTCPLDRVRATLR